MNVNSERKFLTFVLSVQTYQITFDMRARGGNVGSADESVVLEINGVKVEHTGYRAVKKGEWTTITAIFMGTGGEDTILFRESNIGGVSDGSG